MIAGAGSVAVAAAASAFGAVCSHWLRSANHTMANSVLSCVRGTSFAPEQIFALAGEGQRDLVRCTTLAQVAGVVSELKAGASRPADVKTAALTRRLRANAVAYDANIAPTAKVAANPTVEPIPQGVAQLPPQRPAGFALTALPNDTVIDVLATLETNSNPVSNPSYALPADPLFATWMKAYSLLGTRSLTMAEMEGLIDSDVRWDGYETGIRDRSRFQIRFDPHDQRMDQHELHKFIGGFRQDPGHGAIDAGRGGETSLFARMTDVLNDHDIVANWGSENAIRDHWREHRSAVRTSNSALATKLDADLYRMSHSDRDDVLRQLSDYQVLGFFADPREEAKLRPHVEVLLSNDPGTPARARAAQAIVDNFRERARNPDVVSVSGGTAEVQMAQTLYRYMAENKLDFQRPNDRIDVVEVYKLYRRMAEAGELTSRATVQGWLEQWGVPHVP